MILKRMSQAFRRQDWLAVLLEFTILIVGIFLGFQVTAWNEARKDRDNRVETVNLLQDELISNLRTIDARVTDYQQRLDQIAVVAEAVATGQLSPEDESDFERGIARIQFFAPVALREAAFDALQQSGAIAALDDKALLIQLNDHRARMEWIATQHRSFRNGISGLAQHWRPYVEHVRDPRPRVTTVRWDLDGMHADTVARSALIEVERMYQIFDSYTRSLGQSALELCETLSSRTGRSCENPDN